MKTRLAILITFMLVARVYAEVRPHHLISDNAVLQQGMDVPVWGTADEGEKVTVKFQDQEQNSIAKDGKWSIRLKPLKAGGPFAMTISASNVIEVKDILVGEVWVCGGQSNMYFPLQSAAGGADEAARSADPLLRLCSVKREASTEPRSDIRLSWEKAEQKSTLHFSAVGYFFGRDLRKALNVPVGLIHSSYGGTPAEFWATRQSMQADPVVKPLLDSYDASVTKYEAALAKFKKDEPALMEKWQADAEQAKKDNKPAPAKPHAPADPTLRAPAMLYNAMIAPLQPYGIRGVIWYQGEANSGRATEYQSLFPTLIKGWRDSWGQGEFPFLFVQIAPHVTMKPEIREAQLLTWQRVKNTAMVVTADVGEEKDIHPKKKEPVGARLALAALAIAYGEKIEYSGPIYDSAKIRDGKIIVTFNHVGGGLESRGGELKGFTIAGPNKKFVDATATIDGDRVIVSNPDVKELKYVRYGWANAPDVNLFNKDGLPASPFRSDVETDTDR